MFQLFDIDNPVNKEFSRYLFTTEGHIVPLDMKFHQKPWEEWTGHSKNKISRPTRKKVEENVVLPTTLANDQPVITDNRVNVSNVSSNFLSFFFSFKGTNCMLDILI